MLKKKKVRNCCVKTFNFITSNLTFFSLVLPVIVLLVGCGYYHVAPLYNLKEIAYQQQQKDLKMDFVKFHNDLGLKFLYIGKIDAAKTEFNQSLTVDPLNQKARTSLVECDVFSETSAAKRDPQITKMQLDKLLNENPNDPLPYLYLGTFALLRAHNLTDALSNYTKAIDRDKSVADAYNGIGYIYYQQNETDKALEYFNAALNYSYWNVHYRNNIADIYYEKKDYQKANDLYYSVWILDPNFLIIYYGLSNSYRLLGDLKNLEKALYYQEMLVEKLADDNITELENNKYTTICYRTKSKGYISLTHYPEKKYYAYYNITLTYYILGNEVQTQQYLKKANDLHISKNLESDVKKRLDFDIELLQEEQHNLTNKLNDFRKKFE